MNGWGGVIHHFFLPSITTTSLILKVQLTFQIGGGRVANLQVPGLLEELRDTRILGRPGKVSVWFPLLPQILVWWD